MGNHQSLLFMFLVCLSQFFRFDKYLFLGLTDDTVGRRWTILLTGTEEVSCRKVREIHNY
jgi:hypothetical protein